ncbi:MAG: hypothetical protein LEGION0403_FIIPPAGN_02493 [Legionella sp.]|uniref:hypothetical protein n=1 Tax=Legionella sp. TaxID=459 RepID=UPI003D0D7D51
MTDEMAMIFLGTTLEHLYNIPTIEQRRKHLHYKYLLSELKYSELCRKNNSKEELLLAQLDQVYEQALLLANNYSESARSQHSLGLQDLELRSVYQKTNPHASIEIIAEKNSGVEPGFEAAIVEDIVFYLETAFPERNARLNYFNHYQGDFKKLYQQHTDDLPKYLIKQDYSLRSSGKIVPRAKDLKRTQVIKNAYEFNSILGAIYLKSFKYHLTATPQEKNCDAVLEVLANDIARASGMSVQEQTLYKAVYEDDSLKLMLKGKWLKNSHTLAGSAQGSNHNYRITPLLQKPDGLLYIINDSIPDLASYYATLLVQDDYDAFGSKGSNKLEINNQLFGIDFRHAYRTENTLIKKLLPNLHLPADQLKKYKNFSICYDAKRSELMKGVLIYAKLAGLPLAEHLLDEYGDDFKIKISGIKTGSIEIILKEYIDKFEALAEKEPQYKQDYLAIIEKIKDAEKIVLGSIKQLLDKLGDKIHLSPTLHDLLDNLEKASMGPAATSLRSPDNTVLLNHIRHVNDANMVSWSVSHNEQGYQFSAVFPTVNEAQEALSRLQEFTGKSINLDKKQLSFSCPDENLEHLSSQFDEELIKEKFHAKDFKYLNILRQEKALNDLSQILCPELEGLSFNENEVRYSLTIKQGNPLYADPLLKTVFPQYSAFDDAIVITFRVDEMASVLDRLIPFRSKLPLVHSNDVKDNQLNKKSTGGAMPKNISIAQTSEVQQRFSQLSPTDIEMVEMPCSSSAEQDFGSANQGSSSTDKLDAKLIAQMLTFIQKGELINLKTVIHSLPKIPVDIIDDATGDTLLHVAIKEDKPEIVKYLLDIVNVDPLIKNKEKNTALVLAFALPTTTCLELILNKLKRHSYLNKNDPVYQELCDEIDKIENVDGVETPSVIFDRYGEKLVERKNMNWFSRLFLGFNANLEQRIVEYAGYVYAYKLVQTQFDPAYLKNEVPMNIARGWLGRSDLHDSLAKYLIKLFSMMDYEQFKQRLNEAIKKFDRRILQVEETNRQIIQQGNLLKEEIQEQKQELQETKQELQETKQEIQETKQENHKLKEALKEQEEKTKALEKQMEAQSRQMEEMRKMFSSFMNNEGHNHQGSSSDNGEPTPGTGPRFF